MEEMKMAVAKAARTELLISLVKNATKVGFSGKKWCNENGVSTYFIQAAIKLGVIGIAGVDGKRVLYNSFYKPTEIVLLDRLAPQMPDVIKTCYEERDRKPRKPLKTKLKKLEVNITEKKAKLEEENIPPVKTMSDFTIQEILLELRIRGYEYSITKLEEYIFSGKESTK